MMSHKSVARKGTFQHQPPAQQPAQQPAQPKALEEDKKNSSEVKKTSVAAISTALRKFSNKGVANKRSSLTDEFGFSVKQLREMMEARGTEAVEVIEKAGGVEVICEKLRTSPSIGIQNDPTDVKLRQTTFGKNEIPPKDSKSFCALVFEAAQDVVLIMLLISAVVSVILWAIESFALNDETNNAGEESDTHGYIDSAAILGCVVIVVLISAFNDWSKEKQFRGLQKRVEGEHVFAVIRDGTDVQINVFEIVVGDICKVKYGDLIPADGILIQASDLCVDESSLTGESDLVKKSATSDPMVLAGTHVMEGSGTIVVTAVGVNSQSGIILTLLGAAGKDKTEDKDIGEKKGSELERIKRRSEVNTRIVEAIESKSKPDLEKGKTEPSEDHSKSVLQTKLSILAIRIGYFGMVAAAITFFVTVLIFSVTTYGTKKQPFQTAHLNKFINFFITAITILVVAVPEGLPLAVTLSLAYSVKKMLNDNNLVRHLSACETMGNATVICSDKTGTLTTNRMTVVQAFVNGKLWKTLPKATDFQPPDMSDILVQAIALNSASTSRIEYPEGKGQLPTQIGNKTECALLQFVGDIGKNYEQVRKEFPESKYTRVYTFNSARKSMSTVVPLPGGGWRMFTKGASEMVMSMCDGIYWEGGKISSLTADLQKKILDEAITPMADEALRTISIAYRDFSGGEPNWNDEGSIISKMTCLCIVGIEDPVRPEVPDAILKCQRAGVVVRMVTGDNKNTAKSIAMKCGILRPGGGGVVLEGKEFNQKIRGPDGEVSQDLLDKVWPSLRVLARSSPTDKYILVKGIIDSQVSSNREVVAVTGDGTNDGPALKKADVGFAMGLTGTDVAKEASDIILTDDNFTSIVKAVMWGRNVYDSIAKFLQFQLTVNVVAVAVAMIGACTVNTSPLKAVQMLWVNLIMDTLASLALATELPTADLLLRKPYGRTASLISPIMLRNIVTHSIFQLIITLVILFAGPQIFDIDNGVYVAEPSTHLTLVFNTFVVMTLFNEINARKIHGERNVFKGILKNPIYYIIWIGTFAGQILIISFGGRVLFTYPLSLDEWMWCIAFGEEILARIRWPTNLLLPPLLGPGRPYSELQLILEDLELPQLQQQASVFGQPQTSATSNIFGGGGFNQPKPATGNIFGQTQTSTLFGQPNRLPGAGTGSIFGASQATTAAVSPFSTAGQAQPQGTSIQFQPITGSDTMMRNWVACPISTRNQCITCMKEYENKSLEELRLEDYQLGRKAQTQAGMFGGVQQQQQKSQAAGGIFGGTLGQAAGAASSFGQPAPAFGATAQPASGDKFVKLLGGKRRLV